MSRGRRAFVLSTVVFSLLIMAALIAGAWAAAQQSVVSARLAAGTLRARSAAASALAAVLAAWDAPAFDSLASGGARRLDVPGAGGAAVTLEVRRTGGDYFALLATALDSLTMARRTVAWFVRLEPMVPAPRVVARLRADPGGALSARVSGSDSVPPGWSCLSSNDSITIVSIHSQDSDSTFWSLSPEWTWRRLVAWASRTGPGGDSLALRHAAGDAVFDGGRHLGLFLADGDVILRGGAELVGTVMARGSIVFEGRGGAILGAVVAGALRVDPATPLASVRLVHSSCAVALAGRARAPARPVTGSAPLDWFR